MVFANISATYLIVIMVVRCQERLTKYFQNSYLSLTFRFAITIHKSRPPASQLTDHEKQKLKLSGVALIVVLVIHLPWPNHRTFQPQPKLVPTIELRWKAWQTAAHRTCLRPENDLPEPITVLTLTNKSSV